MNINEIFKNHQKYFEDFITRSTYHSNGIEGNTLSYADTYAIIFNDNDFNVTAKPREIYEAINHKYAISHILDCLDQPLSETLIKETAIIINRNITDISDYRRVPVMIKGAEHVPPAPSQLPQMMMYFVHNYNHTVYDSIYQKIAKNHIQFERIHPFEDGNGRTGRLLINFELLRNGLAPIVIPKEDRSLYFKLIANMDVASLAEFFSQLEEKEIKRISSLGLEKESASILSRLSEAKDKINFATDKPSHKESDRSR